MIVSLLLVILIFPITGHATVFWDDGMEYADQPAMAAAWDGASCIGDTQVLVPTTAKAHTGSKSLQEYFTGTPPNYEDGGSCFFGGRRFTSTDTLYTRFYMYLTDHAGTGNFLVGSPTTKITLQFPDSCSVCYSVWWVMYEGTRNLAAVWQHSDGNGANYVADGTLIPQQQWVCVELRMSHESPAGASNGVLQAWINGTQVMNYTNLVLLKSGGSGPFTTTRVYTQNGLGTIYYDDFAVGDTRIGCLAGGGGGSTAGGGLDF